AINSHAGHISPGSGKACDDARPHWIADACHNNWNCVCRPLHRQGRRRGEGHNHIWFCSHEIGCQLIELAGLTFCEAEIELQVLPFDITEIAEPFFERLYEMRNLSWGKIANPRNLRRLLRVRRERKPNSTAEKNDERAPLHGAPGKTPWAVAGT